MINIIVPIPLKIKDLFIIFKIKLCGKFNKLNDFLFDLLLKSCI